MDLLGQLVLGCLWFICLVEACIWEADEKAEAAASGIEGLVLSFSGSNIESFQIFGTSPLPKPKLHDSRP